ncbi:PH domain-containing protein [Chryseobacterium salivictor]|uniref:Uncharacterized protein YyaB-like PH domain-containing protein n=1 Tax=Chryseobacterium salivictor TaxID=2547600 RepID=A0A4P6ZHE1_9FLAO|nr:PH domain-containing protein [Chryseobacterium salivictor]QBO58988.1 hypothetical protein NBC122_02182 [Chryseobacterium salivictor]
MNTEKLVFKTKIGKNYLGLYIAMLLVILIMTIFVYNAAHDPSMFSFMAGIWIVALLFMVSTFFLLKIKIEDEFIKVDLLYPIYKVDIRTITTVTTGKTMWFGLHKHGTAAKGLIISSRLKNDLYITPEKQNLFLQKILEINPEIIIEKAEG